MKSTRRASIRQVAERAQVSAMTVSNVLRGRNDVVADATRARVLEAVRELDYVPVRSTVQNRHVETRIIGLVFEHQAMEHHPMGVRTYEGLCQRAGQHGYDLLTLLRARQDWVLDREELRFLDRRCDGFIFLSSLMGQWESALQALVEHGIPTVVCYRRTVPKGIATVIIDAAQAMQIGVDHLARQGHTRIAHLAAPTTAYDGIERRRQFMRAMQKRGLHEYSRCIIPGTLPNWYFDYENAFDKIRAAYVTGVVAFNDKLAMGLWEVAARRGVRVPRDLSIVGIDNTKPAAERGLSSINIGFDEVGRAAVDAWLGLHRDGSVEEHSRVLPVELVERKSVRPPST
jgi:LacI family transcriptional regulator